MKNGRLKQAIQFNHAIEGIDLSWINKVDNLLSCETEKYIENLVGFDLSVLARVFKISLNEAKAESEIDGVLIRNLKNHNLIIEIMQEKGLIH